jgi:hypothetical protein
MLAALVRAEWRATAAVLAARRRRQRSLPAG